MTPQEARKRGPASIRLADDGDMMPSHAPRPTAVGVPSAVGVPTRAEALEAVRTLIRFIGDDPAREGLADTPARVVDSYAEFYGGYGMDAHAILSRTFGEVEGYDDMVMLRDINIESHCEHHMVPILGVAHIAYMPASRVVGISKLARIADVFARRLQTQETMTAQIADAIQSGLRPKGVAVCIEANHQCMTTRGVHKEAANMVTTRFTGIFRDDESLRNRFLAQARNMETDD